MSRWWRAYDEAVDDPKVQQLPPPLFKHWFNLMCITSANEGAIPAIGIVAFKLRVSEHKAAEIITALVQVGLIDRREDGGFEPHNWGGRQYRSDVTDPTAANRMRNYRNRKRNATVTETVTVTPPRDRVQNTEEEKKDAAPPPSELEKELFVRGKQVLGKEAGGLIAKLLKAKQGSIPLARAAIEQASEKQNPREYVGRIVNGPTSSLPLTPAGNPWPEGIT